MAAGNTRNVVYVGIAALLWNLLGLAAQIGDAYAVYYEAQAMAPDQKALADAMPAWAVLGGMVATLAGAAGSLGLILRKAWAVMLFIVSLVGLLLQDCGLYLATAASGTYPGSAPIILQGVVLVIAIFLLVYARGAKARGALA